MCLCFARVILLKMPEILKDQERLVVPYELSLTYLQIF